MDSRVWHNFDFILLAATAILIIFGLAMIHSATFGMPGMEGLAFRQAAYAAIGLGVMVAAAAIDYRLWWNLQKPFYALAILLLLTVLIAGSAMHGARRWIDLKLFPFQPSELAKVILIIVLARHFAMHEGEPGRFLRFLVAMAYVVPIAVLIYLQPNLGTSLIMLIIWLAMALMAGVRVLHLVFLGLAGAAIAPFIWRSLEDYMRQRFLLFLNPTSNPAARYNVDQALISIGSGGWLGKGFAHGSQSQLHFLRVRHTDFIFSVIGEEMGFLGALVVLVLLAVILLRIVRAAEMARDTFGKLIAYGVATVIFLQGAVNIGMNLGLLPVTGTPLPFVSYGGSSLITLLLAEGFVQSVVMRHKKIEF